MDMRFVRSSGIVVLAATAIMVMAAPRSYPVSPGCSGFVTAVTDLARTYDQTIVIDVLANDVLAEVLDPGQGPTTPPGIALEVEHRASQTTCPGTVNVSYDVLIYTPGVPLAADCQIGYKVSYTTPEETSEAIGIVNVIALDPPPEIFSDDFESADASAWSSCNGCI